MENASKALLIAGAILIVILLIGVGMMVFNGAQESIGGAMDTMSAQEIQAFNSQFSSYEGKVKGTSVKSLLQTVIASNSSNTYGRTIKVVQGTGDGTSTASEISTIASGLTSTKQYTISFDYATDGTINKVIIN